MKINWGSDPFFTEAKEVHCFKKIHNALDKDGPICRGLISKFSKNSGSEKSFNSPRGCCKNGGVGYAQQLVRKADCSSFQSELNF